MRSHSDLSLLTYISGPLRSAANTHSWEQAAQVARWFALANQQDLPGKSAGVGSAARLSCARCNSQAGAVAVMQAGAFCIAFGGFVALILRVCYAITRCRTESLPLLIGGLLVSMSRSCPLLLRDVRIRPLPLPLPLPDVIPDNNLLQSKNSGSAGPSYPALISRLTILCEKDEKRKGAGKGGGGGGGARTVLCLHTVVSKLQQNRSCSNSKRHVDCVAQTVFPQT